MWTVIREFYRVFVEPILVFLGWATWGCGDSTYGRNALDYSPQEYAAIYDNAEVKVTRRRVYLSKGKPILDVSLPNDVPAVPSKIADHFVDQWINYYVWEMPSVTRPVNADVYLVHGINDYSVGSLLTQGKVVPQALGFMMAGFRAIALDMPGFGRSTGLHAYIPSLRLNANALNAVMYHVRLWDEVNQLPNLATRKRFAQGSSMGGFTVLYHAALHPPVAPVKQGGPAVHDRLSLDGLAVSAPMLQIAPESRPNKFVEFAGRVVSQVAGRLPFARAIKGNVSDDPKVEYYAERDAQVYHGLVRIDTGLSVIAGLDHLNAIMMKIQCPVAIHHGANDRVTSPEGSRAFFERLEVQPKKLRIWPGIEHGR